MGVLGGTTLKNIFGNAFRGLFEDATLEYWVTGTTRSSDGTFPVTKSGETACKVQFDDWNEYYRGVQGFSDEDTRILMLQMDVSTPPSTDDIIVHSTGSYRVVKRLAAVGSTHWDIQARAI